MASELVVASGLAPRWAAQQPQQTHPSYPRHTEQAGFGAASPPNGGQAPSPHLPRQPPDCGQSARCGNWARHGKRACCGERACPALGCAAAPKTHPGYPRHTEQAGFGAASPPNGGQAPSPHLPRQPAFCARSARRGERARHGNRACRGERACPRWAAQQPQQTHPSYPRHTEQ